MSSFKSKTYKPFSSFGFNRWQMGTITCVVDIDTGPDLVCAYVLDHSRLSSIRQCDMPEITNASNTNLVKSGTITLQLKIVELGAPRHDRRGGQAGRTCVARDHVQQALYQVKIPDRNKNIPLPLSARTQITGKRGRRCSKKLDIRCLNSGDLVLLVAPRNCVARRTTVSRQVVLKVLFETSVIFLAR